MKRGPGDLIARLEANAYALELTIQSNHDRSLALLLREAPGSFSATVSA